MSTCARCGLEQGGDWTDPKICSAEDGDDPNCSSVIDCRNRELLALRSLLRSVTGKLEEARELLDIESLQATLEVRAASELIDSVLEILS